MIQTEGETDMSIAQQLFQFHLGMIQTCAGRRKQAQRAQFQFHLGMIQTNNG